MSGDGSNKVGRRSQHFHNHQIQRTKAHLAFSRVTAKVQQLKIQRVHNKQLRELRMLTELVEEALEEARQRAEQALQDQRYEVMRSVDAVKQQLKNLLDSLPPEFAELEEWEQLQKKLLKSGERDDKNTFARGTQMNATTRKEVHLGEVKRWVSKTDTKVGTIAPRPGIIKKGMPVKDDGTVDADDKRESGGTAEVGAVAAAETATDEKEADRLTFHNVCDGVRRRKRRGEELEPDDIELVADRAYVLMRELRNELSPSWKPEEVPRWLNAGDKYVFDMALASVPKELFEATAGYQGIQDLRKQQSAFTLRAA
ncbi:MAG TPA: hypothetical protein VLC93_11060, partial [Myxococcota bacterium]|nr:hypothetical protein [Myxococcota bacterium]